jgi:glycine/D-amino acid oxidase-like deaminating enzyme
VRAPDGHPTRVKTEVGHSISAGSTIVASNTPVNNRFIIKQHDLLIVGGEDHKTGQEDDGSERFERLIAWTAQRFPVLGDAVYRWSGQVMEPIDSLAFIGRNPGDSHVYIVSGDSGNGMTHGAIASMLLTDVILARDNPWCKAYDPSRKSLGRSGSSPRKTSTSLRSTQTG